MAFPFYLAMTAAEYLSLEEKPKHCAWMACHFSPYGTGLSNLPDTLAPGSMLILNDRTPIRRHNPQYIASQLQDIMEKFSCESLLLDLQREENRETADLVDILVHSLTCPVGVSSLYAEAFECPVFLPPIPPDTSPAAYLSSWKGRDIWLEGALDALEITVTEKEAKVIPIPHCLHLEDTMQDNLLHCHYKIHANESHAKFLLFRTREDLESLKIETETLGVSRMIGLYQELG